MQYKIISWNINSIRARLDLLKIFIEQETPDVILLQETKVKDELFPVQAIELMGYSVSFNGEMRYNGVAILSKHKINDVHYMNHDKFDNKQEARYLDAHIAGFRIATIYVPNGRELDVPHFHYKKNFYKSLEAQAIKHKGQKIIFGGDYNIVPNSKGVWGGVKFDGQIICSDEERSWYKSFQEKTGLIDVLQDVDYQYTWWDYRHRAVEKNLGYKIDTFFVSEDVKVIKHYICKYMRHDKSIIKDNTPSDHAPICLIMEDNEGHSDK